MKKIIIISGSILCLILSAHTGISKNHHNIENKKILKLIDSSYQEGVNEYLKSGKVRVLKESLDLCMQALKANGENYELLWRSVRAAAQYAESSSAVYKEGWEEICRYWGNRGTVLALKAQAIEPKRVEAYYWQTVATGKRATVASTFEILKEDIFGKLMSSMDNAYKTDKSYNDYAPVLSYMQFYISLPWPFNDNEKALKYYEEFIQNQKNLKNNHIVCVLCADFLISLDDEKYLKKAAELLDIAMKNNSLPKYYREKAKELYDEVRD